MLAKRTTGAAVVSAGTVSPARDLASLSADAGRVATEANAPVAVNAAPMVYPRRRFLLVM